MRDEKTTMRNFKKRERRENKDMLGSEKGRGNVRLDIMIEDERERLKLDIKEGKRKTEVKYSN